MKYNITIIVEDTEEDILCKVEAYSFEDLMKKLRKVEHIIAKHDGEFLTSLRTNDL